MRRKTTIAAALAAAALAITPVVAGVGVSVATHQAGPSGPTGPR